MLAEIIKLRKQGSTFQGIADQLGISVKKVRYHWSKYEKTEVSGDDCLHGKLPVDANLFLSITLISSDKLFCSWALAPWFRKSMMSAYAPSANEEVLDLRLYDVTDINFSGNNAHNVYGFKVSADCSSWQINGLKPNRSYLCELGFLTCHPCFFPLLRSHPIQTPAGELSQQANLDKFRNRQIERPLWVEHVSTYSYYDRTPGDKDV